MLNESTWLPIATWLAASPISDVVNSSTWIFPASETLHFLGLILLFGSLLIMDLRILGYAKALPLQAVMAFTPYTIIGFAINLVTGAIFVLTDPIRYFSNLSFQLKIICIIGAMANVLYFKYVIHPRIDREGEVAAARTDARFVAAASLVLWTLVIVFGRLIPYLGSDGG
jgi:hypothetical protein